jgi:hypothetical protein
VIDSLALLLGCFLIFIFLTVLVVGVKLLKAMFTFGQIEPSQSYCACEEDLVRDSVEQSEGDGLMTLDDQEILFPLELDDDD